MAVVLGPPAKAETMVEDLLEPSEAEQPLEGLRSTPLLSMSGDDVGQSEHGGADVIAGFVMDASRAAEAAARPGAAATTARQRDQQ